MQVLGRMTGASRGRHVVLQARSGRRWRRLVGAAVLHGRFKVTFTAPSRPGVLVVRAVAYRRGRRSVVSKSRKIVIGTYPQAPLPPPPLSAAGWGENTHSELDAGYIDAHSTLPVPVIGLAGIQQVVAGGGGSLALLSDGTVAAWGGNSWGEVGDGTHTEATHPIAVRGLGGVTSVAISGGHAMALLGNGTVMTWGSSNFGQLGNGLTGKGSELRAYSSTVPLLVPGLSGVAAIAAGGADDVALLKNGTLLAWGENHDGQLGDGTTVEKTTPTPVKGLAGVKAVAMGGDATLGGHMLALLNNGTVMAVGGIGLAWLMYVKQPALPRYHQFSVDHRSA